MWLLAGPTRGTDEFDLLLRFGAVFGPLVASGEYWRLLTGVFLHVGLPHLMLNGFGLYIFGPVMERVLGHIRFLTIYVLAGLFGSVASLLFHPVVVGAGASGAVFGLVGALAAFFVVRRDVLSTLSQRILIGVLALAGINLVLGFATPGIGNAAHMGGFSAGFALALALTPGHRGVRASFGTAVGMAGLHFRSRGWWVVPVAVAMLVMGTWLAVVTLPDNPYSHFYQAEDSFERRDYETALAELGKAIQLRSDMDSKTEAKVVALLFRLHRLQLGMPPQPRPRPP